MKMNPVGWFEIYVNDMSRAVKFYESVLECKLSKMEGGAPSVEMWAFPAERGAPGTSGTLCKMEGFPAGRNSVLIYFVTPDCGAAAKRVEAAGGKIQKQKMSIGEYGFISLAVDTEGNMFGLHSMK